MVKAVASTSAAPKCPRCLKRKFECVGWILNKRSCDRCRQDHRQKCIDGTWVSDRKDPVSGKGKGVLEDLLDVEASEREEEIEEEEEEEVALRKRRVVPKDGSPASENQKEVVDEKGKRGRPKKRKSSIEKEVKTVEEDKSKFFLGFKKDRKS